MPGGSQPGEEIFSVGGDDNVRSAPAVFGQLNASGVANLDIDELAIAALLVNGNANVLFVTEVDVGLGGMVSHVARAGAFRWPGVQFFKWRESTSFGIELVLEEGIGVFDVGDVNELIIG